MLRASGLPISRKLSSLCRRPRDVGQPAVSTGVSCQGLDHLHLSVLPLEQNSPDWEHGLRASDTRLIQCDLGQVTRSLRASTDSSEKWGQQEVSANMSDTVPVIQEMCISSLTKS